MLKKGEDMTKKKVKKTYKEKLSEARIALLIARYETIPQREFELRKEN